MTQLNASQIDHYSGVLGEIPEDDTTAGHHAPPRSIQLLQRAAPLLLLLAIQIPHTAGLLFAAPRKGEASGEEPQEDRPVHDVLANRSLERAAVVTG